MNVYRAGVYTGVDLHRAGVISWDRATQQAERTMKKLRPKWQVETIPGQPSLDLTNSEQVFVSEGLDITEDHEKGVQNEMAKTAWCVLAVPAGLENHATAQAEYNGGVVQAQSGDACGRS